MRLIQSCSLYVQQNLVIAPLVCACAEMIPSYFHSFHVRATLSPFTPPRPRPPPPPLVFVGVSLSSPIIYLKQEQSCLLVQNKLLITEQHVFVLLQSLQKLKDNKQTLEMLSTSPASSVS